MATYTLTVKIDQKWVKQYNSDPERLTKLCMASAVDSGVINYNVVAHTENVGGTVTISWVDQYAIGASSSSFSNGVQFDAQTSVVPIQFGQTYKLPEDFTDSHPQPDKSVPKASFAFENEAIASAILYKKIKGELRPIYFSAAGPLAPGREELTPKPLARLWFAANFENSTMVSKYSSKFIDIDYTGITKATVAFGPDGIWSRVD